MKISIKFPTVMKMVFESKIEIENSATLKDVKQKVFDTFWHTMKQFIHVHGNPDQVILKDESNVEIADDFDLKKKLEKSTNFIAVFGLHPETSEKKKETSKNN